MCATNHCDCPPEIRKAVEEASFAAVKNDGGGAFIPFGHPRHIPIVGGGRSMTDSSNCSSTKNKLGNLLSQITSNSKVSAILATSQPVHALAIITVGVVFSCITGELSPSPKPFSTLTTFVYIVSFALRVGSQYWMTFISGLSLYFTLERHAFGDVQIVLFPRYFTSNAVLSAICLISYSKLNSHVQWETIHWIQMGVMSTSFLLESLSRLYLAPQVVDLIVKKKAIEMTQPGVGKEIGRHEPGALKNCPHYMSLHSQFRKKHMIMAAVNVTTIACTVVQLCCICRAINLTSC